MASEWERGAMTMRDNIISHIIGMQNRLGNNTQDKGYQELQKLLELIESQYGEMLSEIKTIHIDL